MGNRSVKVVLLGDQGVGKTSLRCQFLYHYFSSSYKATVGADFLTYKVKTHDDEFVNLQIWDTAGQERFNAVSRAFYRGADIGILVYDITNPDTFYNLDKWLENFVANARGRPYIVVVGNKLDRESIRRVSSRQAVEFASHQEDGLFQDVDKDVLETSAKRHEDVEKVFQRCAQLGALKVDYGELEQMGFDTVDIDRKASGCGC